jgi:hypothetical protein
MQKHEVGVLDERALGFRTWRPGSPPLCGRLHARRPNLGLCFNNPRRLLHGHLASMPCNPGIVEADEVHLGPLHGHEPAAWVWDTSTLVGHSKLTFCSAKQKQFRIAASLVLASSFCRRQESSAGLPT